MNTIPDDTPDSILAFVDEARNAELQVLPIRQDGSKRPRVTQWAIYQRRWATDEEVSVWFPSGTNAATGVGLVTGFNDLECLEFDDEDTFHLFMDTANAAGLDFVESIADGFLDRSPGGFHLLYRCSAVERNQKLAGRPAPTSADRNKVDVLIETRGIGGMVICAPSYGAVQPDHEPYVRISGSPSTIRTITPDQRDQMFRIARAQDERPVREFGAVTPRNQKNDGDRPGDLYNRQATETTFRELLGSDWQWLY